MQTFEFATSDLIDLAPDTPSCEIQFRSFGRRSRFCGRIRTVKCFRDNGLIKQLMNSRSDGEVLVVDGDDGFVQGEGQRVGIARTGQKRAAQPRPLGEGHRVDVGIVFARVAQAGTGQRHEAADVVAAGQLGHHAAVFGVHGHLGVQGVGE